MNIFYLKNKQGTDLMYFPHYYKVTNDQRMTVSKTTIDVEKIDDHHDEVSFIKEKLCDGEWEEISREKFDEFYKKQVEVINNLSKI